MAEHLARIIGTEEDRINCPFYWKIGACRHGDQCSRTHYKPTASQTLILRHMYENPPSALAISEGQDVDDDAADEAQDHFEAFYFEVWTELAQYGELEDIIVCDNIGDHMIGNLYVKFTTEEYADNCLKRLRGRSYAEKLIEVEFSPVTDFRESRCRQFVEGCCTRGGYCNFMHLKHVPRSLRRKLLKTMYDEHADYNINRDKDWNISTSRPPLSQLGGNGGAAGGAGGGGDYYRRGYDRRKRDYYSSRSYRDDHRDYRERDYRDRDYGQDNGQW
ncbi:putative U2 snRNP auxiliary factor, small subunit [Gregarina niphandrodes]|uniref:U2 snRNP auxiliary factor, small subunit n=1 Tax=Gregarina niphandrodes TaxID=110365 RepID=A0A023B0R5_GRENI|nr:putative U2 snRNP auxiliary factor, small subunit [Gregarina niphandrodes]EZG45808.1 putative U2 snRNP auxiliary factor, small subunit [Gregarina niphandrodes]|eukprot:XP_011132445.1 putative U2 snRNP auxiliary factor, small subunit [Gregarina niphandrodes]